VQPLLEQAVAITGLLPPLRDRIAEVEKIVDEGAALFEQMASQHVEAAWQAIRGNGTEADNRLEWAQKVLEESAADLASEEAERWAAVPGRVQQARGWLDEAVTLVQSIRDHEKHLDQARQAAPKEVQQVKEDIVKAREYIHQYDRDIREQLEHELDAAEPDWGLVYKELNQERSDYLGILTLVRGVRQVADRILAEARSEHETIKRLAQRYTSRLRETEGTLSTARNYLRNHFRDVKRGAHSLLEQAEQALRWAQEHRAQADRLEDTMRRKELEEAVRLLREAGEGAEGAYARAQRDVRQAEEARRPAPRPSVPTGPGPWAVPGGWGTPRPAPSPFRDRDRDRERHRDRDRPSERRRGGGSSTGWGGGSGGSRRGGSSTGWGSSRRRGGGSTGW
jgi:hypothetical protein